MRLKSGRVTVRVIAACILVSCIVDPPPVALMIVFTDAHNCPTRHLQDVPDWYNVSHAAGTDGAMIDPCTSFTRSRFNIRLEV